MTRRIGKLEARENPYRSSLTGAHVASWLRDVGASLPFHPAITGLHESVFQGN